MRWIPLLLVTMLHLPCTADAQDLRKVLEGLKGKYDSAAGVRITMSINAYESKDARKPFYQENAVIEKHGTSYRYKLRQTDMIMNDKYIVVVDHSTHEVMVNDRDVREESRFFKQSNINMDTLFRLYETGKYDGVEEGSNKYSIPQSGEISKMELFIDPTSGIIQKLNYSYKTGQWVTIKFEEFDLASVFDPVEFNEEQFISRLGKKWQPSASLKNYRVVLPAK